MKYSILIFLFVIASTYSCKKKRFKKDEFLEELYENDIRPELKNASDLALQLNASWETYKSVLSAPAFNSVQTGIKRTLSKLEEISLYNLGDINQSSVYNKLYKTDVDTANILAFYEGQDSFTGNDFNAQANAAKGIFALEYLFFSELFESLIDEPKFQNYASAMMDNLRSNLTNFKTNWETYKETFITQLDEGESDSYNIVLNRLIHRLENITKTRISGPLAAGDPALLPGYISNSSTQNIKIITNKIKAIYYGTGIAGDFNSIAINVKKKNKKLAESIDAQFEEILVKGRILIKNIQDYIPEPKGNLVAYNESVKGLLVLFKVDVVQELGIVLTAADIDGD